jgi:hypothetical protein
VRTDARRKKREITRVSGRATIFPRCAILARANALDLVAIDAAHFIGRKAQRLVEVRKVQRLRIHG